MEHQRLLRILNAIKLLPLVVLVVGVIYVAVDVWVTAPVEDNEVVVVPERTLGADGRWHVGNNWLGRDSLGIYEAYIEGADLERGLAYGALANDLIVKQEEIFVGRLREMIPGAVKLDYLKYFVAWYDRDLDEHVPREYLREIYGVSRSFSDSFDFVGPKYIRALNYHAAHDIGHAMQDLAMVGCTSFAARGTRTSDGQLLVARNFDFWMGEEFAHDKLITFVRPAEGIPHVLVGWGGFMGAVSAMNLQGLTVTINAARSAMPLGARTPISILTRDIVQHASTIDEAIAIAERHEVFVSESILIASAKDGRAAIIEKAPDGMDVYDPGGDLLVCANHYQGAYFENNEVNLENKRESDSMERQRRMQALLDSAVVLDPKSAATILRDRRGTHNADIGLGNPMAVNQLIAHHAVLMQPEALRFWVSAWPYQLGAFVGYDLKDVFARCGTDSIRGPINDATLTIAADPFIGTTEFTEHQYWQAVRVRIAMSSLAGNALDLSTVEEERFVRANPRSYITYAALGDLRRTQERYDDALYQYAVALAMPVASLQERTHLRERMVECLKAKN